MRQQKEEKGEEHAGGRKEKIGDIRYVNFYPVMLKWMMEPIRWLFEKSHGVSVHRWFDFAL